MSPRAIGASLIAFSGGLAILFLFFAAIGTIGSGKSAGLAIAAAVFALIWFAGAIMRRRRGDDPERVTRVDRERRGF